MRKIILFIVACFIAIADAHAAVRGTSAISRTQNDSTSSDATTVIARTSRLPTVTTSQQQVSARSSATTTRNDSNSIVSRADANNSSTRTQQTETARAAAVNRSANPTTQTTTKVAAASSPRSATNTIARSATSSVARSATSSATTARSTARATTTASSTVTNTFGTGYNQCRNAYFTCMDQFCATANDSYRRCVCSSRLKDIQERERALSQASDQIQDFKNLNIEVIPKTAEEVNAMLGASEGEQAITEDNSASAQQLAGIKDVLSSS